MHAHGLFAIRLSASCLVLAAALTCAAALAPEPAAGSGRPPNFVALAGAGPPDNPSDGRDVWDLIAGKPEARNPHDYYAFCTGSTFEGVLSGDGRWKLHVPHSYRTLAQAGNDGSAGTHRSENIGLTLFDMLADGVEAHNVIDEYPEVGARLQAWAEAHRREFYGE